VIFSLLGLIIFLSFLTAILANICIDKMFAKYNALYSCESDNINRSLFSKTLIFVISIVLWLNFYLFVFPSYASSMSIFVFFVLIVFLISVSVIDLKFGIIPDVLPLFVIIFALLLTMFNPFLEDKYMPNIINSLLGFFCGSIILFLTAVLGKFLYKKETMGGGDIKMMAGVGALIGFDKVILSIFVGFFAGALAGIFLICLKKTESKGYIPFAPFLAAGTYISLFCPSIAYIFNKITL
jgi:leader peptidase (prepilin peptidase)/N-methyltransferase